MYLFYINKVRQYLTIFLKFGHLFSRFIPVWEMFHFRGSN